MNIFVGSLNFKATEEDLRQLFSEFGTISTVKVIKDFDGRSRGFGFVEMPENAEANNAINSLNGKSFMNFDIVVNEARPKTSGGGGGGGNRGGGGGYSRDRGYDRGGDRGGDRGDRGGDRDFKKRY